MDTHCDRVENGSTGPPGAGGAAAAATGWAPPPTVEGVCGWASSREIHDDPLGLEPYRAMDTINDTTVLYRTMVDTTDRRTTVDLRWRGEHRAHGGHTLRGEEGGGGGFAGVAPGHGGRGARLELRPAAALTPPTTYTAVHGVGREGE
jgi:hypothetical protein